MKKFICSLFVGGLLSFAPMFSVAQSQSAMEAYLCTLNDSKSMSDLMEVVEDWNKRYHVLHCLGSKSHLYE